MKWKTILIISVLLILSLTGISFTAGKKTSAGPAVSSEKEYTGERRGVDGVGRVYWIRNAEGKELTFLCDDKSLLISKKGNKAFSEISPKEFIELFKLNEMVTVKYVEKNGKKLIKSIGPAAIAK
ncbi:MAG: hypothetical protein A2Y79_14850 [Deltaproteobacteria bacterium RBG_13_43_22]|jgi:hypothetical protein|nr:MAG: hypothetical protein A2Y79_14850 [Deltaproteobacteria bacterium RBG_13_43_22]